MNSTATATVTNRYRKITLTKKDSVDTDHLVDGAVYKLYKVDNASSFLAASDLETALNYCTVVKAPDNSDWTGTTSNGQIIVRDAGVKGGISDGQYVFVEQSAPTGYNVNNVLTDKIITVNSTNDTDSSYSFYDADYAYKVTHTDIRNRVKLTLEKKLADDTNSTTYGGTPFTYTVTLTAPTDGTHLKDFITVVNETNTKTVAGTAVNSIITDSNNEIKFTVLVSANDTGDDAISFSGLPYGTKYSVTEANPSNDDDWRSTANSNVTESTGMTGDVTASYTNAKTGELELAKALQSGTDAAKDVNGKASGDAGFTAPANGDQTFSYTVTMVTPDGVVIDSSAHGLTLTNASFATGEPTVTQIDEGEATAHSQVTFTISNVSKNNKVTVSGIPHGTTYYVTEDTLSSALTNAGWTKVTTTTAANGDTPAYDETGSIGDTASTATIKNGLVHKLKLKKKVTGTGVSTAGVNVGSNYTEFVYNVALYAPDGADLRDHITRAALEDLGAYNILPANENDPIDVYSFSIKVTSADNGYREIENIPFGTTYTVTEAEPSHIGTDLTITGQVETATPLTSDTEVEIENNYTTIITKSIKIRKVKAAANGDTIVPTTNNTFVFTVSLKAPLNTWWSIYVRPTIQIGDNGPSYLDLLAYNRNVYTFKVTLDNGQEAVISGLPINSSYSVTEVVTETENVVPEGYLCETTGENDTSNYINITNFDTQIDIPITNTYTQVGTLNLAKTLAKAPGTDNYPASLGETPKDYSFEYNVVMKAPNGLTWTSQYLTAMGFTDPSTYTLSTGNATDGYTTLSFSKSVTDNDDVSISNVPYGTTYTVTENYTCSDEGYSCASVPTCSGNADANGYRKIKDDNNNASVEYTNTYTQLGSLSLKKIKEDAGNIYNQNEYSMNVVLTPPGTMTATELKAYSSNLSSFTADDSSTPKKLTGTVQVTAGSTVTLSNIPYGTKIAVEEADGSQNMTSNVEYSIDSGANYSRTSVTELEVDGAKSVFVRNTYPQLGSLKITKTVDYMEEAPATETQQFSFSVTLEPEANTVVALEDFTIALNNPADGVSMSETTVTKGVMTFTVTITGAGSATISGIPAGTHYFVNEQTLADAPQWSLESSSGENGTVSATEVGEASFTNLNTPTIEKAVVLFKQDAKTNAGIPGAYFYLLKLNSNVDTESESFRSAFAESNITEILNSYADVVTTVGTTVTIPPETGTSYQNILTTDDDGYISLSTGVDFTDGTSYVFYEVAPSTTVREGEDYVVYINDNTLTSNSIITIRDDQAVYTVTHRNLRQTTPTDVELLKTNDDDEILPGAELDLYYRETTTPSTYSPNSPYYVPDALRTTLLNGSLNVPTVPAATNYATYTYTYQYQDMPVPSAQDYDWIQPRTDNDYIYFRDYTQGTTAMWDSVSFAQNNGGLNNEGAAQNGKRSWIRTDFKDNIFHQAKEIDYDHSYWIMAVFSGHPTKSEKPEYGVWERFVDRYQDQDTVVWKIQPPDGYTKVRFLLYHDYYTEVNGQWIEYKKCVRSTKEITFKLGNIYHRNGYGTWKKQYNHECYFDVDTVDEGTWSTYKTTQNNSQTGQRDKRQGTNGNNLYQADRYTPTQQKVIFHCNSATVWHNIHIEFFTDEDNGSTHTVSEGGKTYYAIGQTAPGYLMEPYAYAGGDYRINGFLTYELTIPEGAKYFRVNNGVLSGTNNKYYYSSNITRLKTYTTRKNYGKYFSINGSSNKQTVTENNPVTLKSWNNYTNYGDKWNETYSSVEVDSDYDYIYFEKPADWSDHVYAYFYAGNDLRDDNYNRATYSAWPGVEAVATWYVETDKNVTVTDGVPAEGSSTTKTYNSDQYTYSYEGSLYTSTADGNPTNPETTIKGKTIYKFRIPKSELKSYANGEKRNYDKVIFNDGLNSTKDTGVTKTHETHKIDFEAGALYNYKGKKLKSYSSTPTVPYTKRDGDSYLYIKTTGTDTTNWDNMHVTFYKENGDRILQNGNGYIMEFASKQKETVINEGTTVSSNVEYTYYRIPIPNSAYKFKINNGGEDSTRKTSMYDIPRQSTYAAEGGNKSDYTEGRVVYELDGTTLNMTSPTFPSTEQVEHHTSGSQASKKDYTARPDDTTPDFLYIRDTAGWNIGIGGGQVKFYDSTGTLIQHSEDQTPDGDGTYILLETNAETTEPTGYDTPAKWYKIEIPQNAAEFTVTYSSGSKTTSRYAIYPVGDNTKRDGKDYTTGDMYYETQTGGLLSVISSTVTELGAYENPSYVPDDTRDGQGGDYLYLVCSDPNNWPNMAVKFTCTNNGTTTTVTALAQYLNEITLAPEGQEPIAGETTTDSKAAGHWYRVAIPEGATAFTVINSAVPATSLTSSAAIYELAASISRYKKDYTLGDMQYRLPDTGTKPTLLYPVFTEIEPTEATIGDETISTTSLTPVDASQIDEYAQAAPATMPTGSGEAADTLPILYATSNGTVTYKWGSGKTIYFEKNNTYTNWSSIKAYFYNGSGTEIGTSVTMEQVDSSYVYKATIPDGVSSATNPYVIFKNGNGSGETAKVNLTSTNSYGDGYKFIPTGYTSDYIYYDKENWPANVRAVYKDSNGTWQYPDGELKKVIDNLYKWEIVSGATELKFREWDNPNNYHDYGSVSITSNSGGKVYKKNGGNGLTEYTNHPYNLSGDSKVSGTFTQYMPAGGGIQNVSYQPEDRYGMISDLNSTTPAVAGTADADNFIYIRTTSALTNPVINFYDNDSGTGTPISVALNYTAVMNGENEVAGSGQSGDGTTTAYKIRLPKNARSFKITGKSGNNNVTSGLQVLYQDNVTVTRTETIDETEYTQTYTLSGTYHHAGTTFTVNSTGAVTGYELRSGFTPNRATTMTDPLNPRSDKDYVFFTDTDNTIGASGTVYAYFYGSADGEFKAWPGIAASTTPEPSSANPTSATAYSTYTDNYGRTVYMFRIPQGEEGTYTHVIFSNGTNTGRKTTQAAEVVGGNNYILDTTAAEQQAYGTFSPNAYKLTAQPRTNSTVGNPYSVGGTNRYIYIVNNGTQNLTDGQTVDQNSRYILDDIHVEFFDETNRPVVEGTNGTNYSGLKPDKLNKGYNGYDVYRIQVPNGAKYFRINNGEKDVDGDTNTQWNERQSEKKAVTANGLYQFVQGKSNAADYIQSGEDIPADEAARENPHYLLTLVNQIQTDEDIPETQTNDIKLATVVTKDSKNSNKGNIDYISWLKLNDEGTQVDREYLDHTTADIYDPPTNTNKVTTVKVVKDGIYYWVERVAPSGHEKSDEEHVFIVKDGKVQVYNESGSLVDALPANTVTVINEPVKYQSEVILKKTAKEKVGTTDIGDVLAGAKFRLVAVDGTAYRFNKTAADPDGAIEGKKTHEYTVNNSSGTYNVAETEQWLETGEDGRLHIKGLPIGDYYLEEQNAPTGFSEKDSNADGAKKRVCFSVGINTPVKEITCSDEMEPAYIRLFEHISEKRDEWGDPTFIFKIKQVQHYDWVGGETEDDPKVWQLTDSDTEKEILVALTVNDDGTIIDSTRKVLKWVNHSVVDPADPNQFFTEDPINDDLYGDWLVEATSEDEYIGLFRIDEQGRIKVEPGKYEITRLPVSRYEFVTSGHIIYDTDPTTDPYYYAVNEDKPFIEDHTPKVTINALAGGQTADVHYYDKVGYYDKFTQVDEEINSFHQYTDENNAKHNTIKGIRIEDYYQIGTTAESPATPDTNSITNVLTVPVKNLVVYKIMADGSEEPMTSAEKAALVLTYTYDSESKDIEAFASADTGFSFDNTTDSDNPVIKVSYASNYNQGVYTLNADYNGFEASFDIVFVREAPTNITPPAEP